MRGLAAAIALASVPAGALAGVRPAYGGTIRIAVPAGDGSLDESRLVARATVAPLLEIDRSGELRPGLLAEVPAPEVGGRAFRLRLRPGLRTAGGAPIRAADVAARLASLLARVPAPCSAAVPDACPPLPDHGPALRTSWANAWAALPIAGAEALLMGRAASLAGVQVLSETELLVTLAFPFPEFPWALATVATAPPGTGPFHLPASPGAGAPAPGASLLRANENHFRGRPFADALELRAAEARTAARQLERGEVDLVLRPDAAGGAPAVALPALAVTVAVVNGARLGPAAAGVRGALAALDRSDLARRFVRGPAEPLLTVVPPSLLPGAPGAPPRPERMAAPPRLVLLASSAEPDQRAVAERIQVKLFDRGTQVSLALVAGGERFARRLRAGDFDVALVRVPVAAATPALAAAQVALWTRGDGAALRALAALAGTSPPDALAIAERLGRELDLVPLVATGPRAALAPALQGFAAAADGGFDPGDLWLLRGGAP